MICDLSVADWNKVAGVITSVGTIAALVFSAVTLRQTSAYRREDQRDRLLGALIDQLTVLPTSPRFQ